jgi:hypothetical protein
MLDLTKYGFQVSANNAYDLADTIKSSGFNAHVKDGEIIVELKDDFEAVINLDHGIEMSISSPSSNTDTYEVNNNNSMLISLLKLVNKLPAKLSVNKLTIPRKSSLEYAVRTDGLVVIVGCTTDKVHLRCFIEKEYTGELLGHFIDHLTPVTATDKIDAKYLANMVREACINGLHTVDSIIKPSAASVNPEIINRMMMHRYRLESLASKIGVKHD